MAMRRRDLRRLLAGLARCSQGMQASDAASGSRRVLSHLAASSQGEAPTPSRRAVPPDGPGLEHFLSRPAAAWEQASAQPAGPAVHIETYGCQQNVSDTEIVGSILAAAGYRQAASPAEADVVLLNTCSIREKAEAKVFSRLGALRKAARGLPQGQEPVLGVLGCMAERLKERLLARARLADLVVGPDAYRDLPRLLAGVRAGARGRADAMNVQLSLEETYADVTPLRRAGASAAFLSVMRGCNNMCAFCVVPFTRGRERSRPLASILDEVKLLAERGVRELTLLGQNVNSYADFSQRPQRSAEEGAADAPFGIYAKGFSSVYKPRRSGAVRFAELLDAVAAVDPEMRVAFTSPHPKDFSDEVLQVISERPNVARSVHMPAQSGSSAVLQAMRRGYTREAYDELTAHIRASIPGVALSTDMIAGFCGETEADHAASVELMRSTAFEQAFMFAYSERSGTRAARHLQDDVPADVKKRRLNEIIAVFREQLAATNALEQGRRHLVLVEGEAKEPGFLTGRTASLKRVRLPADAALRAGEYADVRITGASAGMLFGEAAGRTSLREFVARHGSVVPLPPLPLPVAAAAGGA